MGRPLTSDEREKALGNQIERYYLEQHTEVKKLYESAGWEFLSHICEDMMAGYDNDALTTDPAEKPAIVARAQGGIVALQELMESIQAVARGAVLESRGLVEEKEDV